MESKYDEHSCKSVIKNSNPLELVDNCIRNDYIYLLNGKDEAIETFRQYNIDFENQLEKS